MAEEPVKPKGRSRKAKPLPRLGSEWALTLEREREAEKGRACRVGRRETMVLTCSGEGE